jgi:hypothetical protein
VSRRAQVRAIGKVVTPPIVVEAAKWVSRRIDST